MKKKESSKKIELTPGNGGVGKKCGYGEHSQPEWLETVLRRGDVGIKGEKLGSILTAI